MKAMSKFWTALVVGVAMGVSLFWATPAKADLLTNTAISWSGTAGLDFDEFADVTTGPLDFLYSDYNFGGGPTEGVVFSAVYKGIGPAADKFVYVYQIKVNADPAIKGISIPFITYPETVSGMTSFYISSGQPGSIGFGQGTVSPTGFGLAGFGAVYDPAQKSLTFNYTDSGGAATLKPQYPVVSMLVGVFSPLPPTIRPSNMLDTGLKPESPADVLVPSPEPSTMVLFGLGLMGIVGTVLRRRKS
jgi:hypothetical protein